MSTRFILILFAFLGGCTRPAPETYVAPASAEPEPQPDGLVIKGDLPGDRDGGVPDDGVPDEGVPDDGVPDEGVPDDADLPGELGNPLPEAIVAPGGDGDACTWDVCDGAAQCEFFARSSFAPDADAAGRGTNGRGTYMAGAVVDGDFVLTGDDRHHLTRFGADGEIWTQDLGDGIGRSIFNRGDTLASFSTTGAMDGPGRGIRLATTTLEGEPLTETILRRDGALAVTGMAPTPDGQFLVLTYQRAIGFLLERMNVQGAVFWSNPVAGVGRDVILAPGGIYTSAFIEGAILVSRMTFDGAVLWTTVVPGRNSAKLAMAADGGVLLATRTNNDAQVTYMAPNGDINWSRGLGMWREGIAIEPTALAVSADGIYVAGDRDFIDGQSPDAAWVARLDGDGARVAAHFWDEGRPEIRGLTALPEGGVLAYGGISGLDNEVHQRVPQWRVLNAQGPCPSE